MFRYPSTVLDASGHGVGLPDGQMGNSEVGHLTLGNGCVVRQDLVLIDNAIANRSFFTNSALVGAVLAAAAKGRPLHLLGLVSGGGVHSHVNHLLALIELCAEHEVRPLLHMITDGRDTPPRSAMAGFAEVEQALARAGGSIATVSGRFFAMHRDRRWERVERAWRAFLVADKSRWLLGAGGGLADMAPTVLQLMGLPAANAMTGRSLLIAQQVPKPIPAVERLNAA